MIAVASLLREPDSSAGTYDRESVWRRAPADRAGVLAVTLPDLEALHGLDWNVPAS